MQHAPEIRARRLSDKLRASYERQRDRVWVTTLAGTCESISFDKRTAEALLRFMADVWGELK